MSRSAPFAWARGEPNGWHQRPGRLPPIAIDIVRMRTGPRDSTSSEADAIAVSSCLPAPAGGGDCEYGRMRTIDESVVGFVEA